MARRQHLSSRELWITALILTFIGCCSASTYGEVADKLCIKYEVVDNDGARSQTRLTLENTKSGNIEKGEWEIHFCSTRLVTGTDSAEGVVVSQLRITHINGCLFKMVPENDFSPIREGEKRVLEFPVETWVVARTDVMANWYVASVTGGAYALITCTSGESLDFVAPFTSSKQYKRTPTDKYSPYKPEERYTMYNAYQEKTVSPSPARAIIPFPAQVSLNAEHVINFTASDWTVVSNTGHMLEVELLALLLGTSVSQNAPARRYVTLAINDNIPIRGLSCGGETDIYRITVTTTSDAEHVAIEGASASGLFYGVQSLSMLVNGNRKGSTTSELLGGSIVDCPRYSYRGVMVDVGRNFHSLESIKNLIKQMGRYKFNKLHLHLTDDEGWRIEIPGIPELTRVGANRCHDIYNRECIMPQLGSSPRGGDQGSGFYSVDDYEAILRTAVENHVEVIPEIDLPGHAHAAIKAMEQRNRTGSSDFLLSDPDDASKYLSVQMFTDNAVNPCIESTYNFVHNVTETIKGMHESIQPLKTFHFGGDEVAATAWLQSPLCDGTNKTDLKLNFTQRVTQDIASMGLAVGAWEDGVMDEHNNAYDINTLTDDVTVYAWSNIWEWGHGDRAYRLANAGYKVVLAHATHLYFDHPQEPDPEDRGYYWATRFIDTQKTFGYSPINIYSNMDVDRMGNAITKEGICATHSCASLEPENEDKILGIQAQVWTETVRTDTQLSQMLWPRLLAVAERAWHQAEWETVDDVTERQQKRDADWSAFVQVVANTHLPELEESAALNYSVRPPGVRLVTDSTKLEALSEFPGMPVVVMRQGSSDWEDFKPETEFSYDEDVLLAVESYNRGHRSRPVAVKLPQSSAGLPVPSLLTLVVVLFTTTFLHCL